MGDDECDDEMKLTEARRLFSLLAAGLVAHLGPAEAVGILTGALMAILHDAQGPAFAAEFLRKVADAADAEHAPPPIPLN